MALSFPLAFSEFFAGLRVAECRFWLPDTRAVSQTRGGEIWDATVANRLWRGSLTLAQAYYLDAAAIEAALELLSEPGRSFLAHPLPLFAPRADPDGSILGSASPTLHTVASNRRDIRIDGLPAGYVLSRGDWVGLVYDTSRRALHRVVTGATANSTGLTPFFEVTPPLRAGTYTNAVTLVRPAIKVRLLPLGDGPRSVRLFTEGRTFDFVQDLRP
jgi:hypothetical protein